MRDTSMGELVDRVVTLRPLSATATRILSLSEDEHFSAQQLAEAIGAEPALAARLLRLANSAYYGFPRRIASVRDAVVLLGFQTVRSVTTAMCLIDRLTGSSVIDESAHWRHSATVAIVAELLAREEGLRPDEGFTAGIVHDIGMLCLAQYCPGSLQTVLDLAAREGVALAEAERDVLGYTDAELGAALAEAWQFPPSLVEATRAHLTPLEDAGALPALATLVVRARFFAWLLGARRGLPGEEPPQPCEPDVASRIPREHVEVRAQAFAALALQR